MSVLAIADEAPRSRAEPGRGKAQDLSHLRPSELYEILSLERRRAMLDLVDFVLRRPGTVLSSAQAIAELCARVSDIGLPLDRYVSSTTVLTPDHDALRRLWVKEGGVSESTYVRPPGEDPNYRSSPFYEAAATGEWVEVWLPDTPDSRFGIVRELKDDGYTHYLCIPFRLWNGADAWLAFATRTPNGFTVEDLATIAVLAPAIANTVDSRVGWNTLDLLLRTYVGEEPHRAILDGNVKRGQVTTIRSALLFADMRDSTGHSADISAPEAVALFNSMFDRLVPPIESRGGEVLKYLGDGLLAIFRETRDAPSEAAERAFVAAEQALDEIRVLNVGRAGQRAVEVGIALHFGEAAYGNVGSGQRLDFTVIGRDVGLASRIGSMNARLGEPLLMSEAFVEHLRRPVVPLGAFAARGFAEPLAVFRPG